ncbi:MAG: tetratricopeptide repeat protein [Vicinamibacterales bacterium]
MARGDKHRERLPRHEPASRVRARSSTDGDIAQWGPWAAASLVAAITVAVFSRSLAHGFLNWDDAEAIVTNPHLDGASLVPWAWTTTHMSHYQPLSWLAWGWIGGRPPSSFRYHALGVVVHAINAALTFAVCWAWTGRSRGASPVGRLFAVTVATLVFAIHPLRVEPVAWVSAFPYLLSYAFLLLAVWAWMAWLETLAPRSLALSTGAFVVSQLARVTAPLAPVVLGVIAWRHADERVGVKRIAAALSPFVVVSLALSLVEVAARPIEDFTVVGLAPRLAGVVRHSGLYLWHTVAPVGLTPLDPLPLTPDVDLARTLVAAAALIGAFGATRLLHPLPAALAAWGSAFALLVPVLGLAPSGLQATADRYTYGPALVLSAALASTLLGRRTPTAGTSPPARTSPHSIVVALAVLGLAGLTAVTVKQLGFWRDSETLWARAVALDATNDVALYNLALAQESGGRTGEAIATFRRLLAVVPDHDLGRRAMTRLEADRDQAEGDRLANAGNLADAVAAYDRALAGDGSRMRLRANRGMALLSIGDIARAADDLGAAFDSGIEDIAVVSGLSFALMSSGRAADARRVLERGRTAHPDDVGIANNLARLLLTSDDTALRDPIGALALAEDAAAKTGGRDPRVLDTLALAFEASGRRDRALATLADAIATARAEGDGSLVAELERRRDAMQRRR